MIYCGFMTLLRYFFLLHTQILAAAVIVGLLSLQLMHHGAECAPAEGLTPFGFLMGRSNDQPAEHPVMRFIAFKPSDGAKFRASFEKKHGPRGRDLIDSLGRGSYKTAADQKEELAVRILSLMFIPRAGLLLLKSLIKKYPVDSFFFL